jgi:hypothetical protein
MSKRNPGGLISTTGLREPSATDQSQNSGVWTLEEQYQADANGTWANPSGQTYEITNSLRFRAANSAFLSRTPASAGNRKTWTWSGWVKLSGFADQAFLQAFTSGNTQEGYIRYSNGTFGYTDGIAGISNSVTVLTAALLRDPSAWYHLMVTADTTSASASDRFKLYINGAQATLSTATYPSQNYDTGINSAIPTRVGTRSTAGNEGFNGYMSDVYLIDGQALDPSYFGYFDYNGVWQPKRYTGVFGTNGFYLPFNPQAYGDSITTTTLGFDKSGNANNWTSNNFSVTAGFTYDLMKDSPTNGSVVEDTGLGGQVSGNYPTIDRLEYLQDFITYSNANLSWSQSAAAGWGPRAITKSTFQLPKTGKWAFAIEIGSLGANAQVGIARPDYAGNPTRAQFGTTIVTSDYATYDTTTGSVVKNGSSVATGASLVNGDQLLVAVDCDAGTVAFYKNGVLQATITGMSTTTNDYWPMTFGASSGSSGSGSWNFGQRPFAYAAPAGFKCLNTANLPMTTIPDSKKYFDVSLWRGDGTSPRTVVSSLNFDPDFVWVKSRSNSSWWHHLSNKVAGIGNNLFTNNTDAELAQGSNIAGFISSTSATGFTVTAGSSSIGSYNANNDTYVAWQWKAGDTTVTNTAGSISSQVRANPTAGFSVVTYTGTGANATVGHGLGVAPKMIICKARSTTGSWQTYHSELTGTTGIFLNLDSAAFASSVYWNNTNPTSSVFSIGTSSFVNVSGQTQVAYCWSEIDGFSKFGSYSTNAVVDGPFIYTGFRPRWILLKASTAVSGGNWVIIDTAANRNNVSINWLFPNLNAAESNYVNVADILSNGFKIRTNWDTVNSSGATMIYAAFAEHPFKTSRAR